MVNPDSTLIEFLKTRRSVPSRNLAEPGPSVQEIREMIAIASRVPDHGKLAPWRFVLYGPERRRRLGERFAQRAAELDPSLAPERRQVERERFAAPAVVAVISRTVADHPKVPVWEQIMSAGAAAMNLLITANAFGWDAQWLTEWMAFDDTLAADLGLEPGERLAGFIHIGTRTLPKTERDRPDIDAIFSIMED